MVGIHLFISPVLQGSKAMRLNRGRFLLMGYSFTEIIKTTRYQ